MYFRFKDVPVKLCASFAKDNCFQALRQSLDDLGIKWMLNINDSGGGGGDNFFRESKMDNIFFHPDRFEILIDVRGFRPEDIKCKISPNVVEVFAQRQESADATSRSVSLSRNYQLPQSVRPEDGNCCLSSEGLLLVTAPWQR